VGNSPTARRPVPAFGSKRNVNYLTPKMDKERAVVVNDFPSRWDSGDQTSSGGASASGGASNAANSGASGGATKSLGSGNFSRFRQLFSSVLLERYDPIVRRATCPQGCVPAPRGPGAGGGKEENDANNALSPSASGSAKYTNQNSMSSGGDSNVVHKDMGEGDHTVKASGDLQSSGTTTRCPHGCLEAPEF